MAKSLRRIRYDKKWDQSQEYLKLDEIKRELCDTIYLVGIRKGWDQRQMAARLGTTRSRISHVYQRHTQRLTLNQLFTYLVLAEPRFKVLVAI